MTNVGVDAMSKWILWKISKVMLRFLRREVTLSSHHITSLGIAPRHSDSAANANPSALTMAGIVRQIPSRILELAIKAKTLSMKISDSSVFIEFPMRPTAPGFGGISLQIFTLDAPWRRRDTAKNVLRMSWSLSVCNLLSNVNPKQNFVTISNAIIKQSNLLLTLCILIDADLPVDKINECMGDPEADVDNRVLKIEQEMQVILIMLFTLHFFKRPLCFIISNHSGVSNNDILYRFSFIHC